MGNCILVYDALDGLCGKPLKGKAKIVEEAVAESSSKGLGKEKEKKKKKKKEEKEKSVE